MGITVCGHSVHNVSVVHARFHPGESVEHLHDVHEFVYVLAGPYGIRVGETILRGEFGDIFYYPPGTLHCKLMPLDGSTKVLVLQWQPGPDDRMPATTVQVRDHRGHLLTSLLWMCDLTPPQGARQAEIREALLFAVLGEFHALRAGQEDAHDPIARVKRWLPGIIGSRGGVKLAEMASAAGVRPAVLHRLFREQTGETPVQYLQRLRVEMALPLIEHTTLPFREIAERVGLCDASYLWRLVVRQYGCSPKDLRAAAHAPRCHQQTLEGA